MKLKRKNVLLAKNEGKLFFRSKRSAAIKGPSRTTPTTCSAFLLSTLYSLKYSYFKHALPSRTFIISPKFSARLKKTGHKRRRLRLRGLGNVRFSASSSLVSFQSKRFHQNTQNYSLPFQMAGSKSRKTL
jgi:hypothetical protein